MEEKKIMKISDWYNLGGIKIVLLKIVDRIFKQNTCASYIETIQKRALANDYPKLLKALYKIETGQTLDLENPRTFNEKIQWLKLYDNTPDKTKLADKYLVRKWIEDKIGNEYLIPLLGVWKSFEDIDFNTLPNKFVLKGNHGSGMNIIVKDKSELDLMKVKTTTDEWINMNFAFKCGLELQYRDIPPVLIAEQYIEQIDNNLLDYKIHCFSGVPKIIQVIGDRDIVAHKGKEIHLDLNWKPVNMMYNTYESFDEIPEKPFNFDEMIAIARKLSEGFRYVRVDLYNIDGKILFGEMTFTPYSGYGKWTSKQAEEIVGSWIDIT